MAEYCKNCGALLTVGLVYCVNCGAPVANLDEGPETVVRHEIDIPERQVTEPVLPPAESRSIVPLTIAAIAAACAVIAIAALFYVLGHQAALRQVETAGVHSNTTDPSPQPSLSPTPLPSPSAAVVQTDGLGPTDCTSNEKAQVHDDCDIKDCDTDASTVAFGISAGTEVTKLGISSQSRKYRWEKVSIASREAWIASTKLDCSPIVTGPPANTRPNTNGKRSAYRASSNSDPWRGVPGDVRAICKDGTYSYAGTHMFQCVLHKGVLARR